MTDHRKRMLPIHLEELLYNKHLWDAFFRKNNLMDGIRSALLIQK